MRVRTTAVAANLASVYMWGWCIHPGFAQDQQPAANPKMATGIPPPLEPWFDKTWRPGEIEEVT
jgi:hypothetical protein